MARLTSHQSIRTKLSKLILPALVSAIAAGGACSKASPPSSTGGGSDQGGAGAQTASSTGGQGGNAGAAGQGGTGGQGGTTPTGCVKDADCAKDANGTICDKATGKCVGCLPTEDPLVDDCGQGQFCDPTSKQCEVGCTSEFDCTAGSQACDTLTNKCVGCVIDTECPVGSICVANTCVPGCSGFQPCQAGFSCCGSSCYDLETDESNCGTCNATCSPKENSNALCESGLCTLGTCKANFADCDANPDNGCEWNVLQDGACACVPGEKQPCYQGAPGTKDIGACKGGFQTCKADGTGWGACVGQVLPKYEICANSIDEDCDGVLDNNEDLDKDGWSSCGGDCCDAPGPGCSNPALSNPGAFEIEGNGQDDDCNPATVDDKPPPCSSTAKFAGVTAEDVVKALDLCQFTTENPQPPAYKTWGVISAVQLLADGTQPSAQQLASIQDNQSAILTGYGSNVGPKKGPTMAGISDGKMRDQDDPGYAGVSNDYGFNGTPPAAYLLANGGKLPSSKNCVGSTCQAGTGAHDAVNVRTRIRVPSNAKGFSYSFKFYSSEYYVFQCQIYNDFFLALLNTSWKPDPLDPKQKPLPADKNISFDSLGNALSVNNSFFEVCAPKDCNACPSGISDLQGTGMQINNAGGATDWLTTDAPVVPKEVIELEFMIFDVGDKSNNSLVLLDNFRWSQASVQVGTHE
jgi:hypothetical protein